MLLEHAKILYAIRSAKEIVGRKKLQKMIYIAKRLILSLSREIRFSFLWSILRRINVTSRGVSQFRFFGRS